MRRQHAPSKVKLLSVALCLWASNICADSFKSRPLKGGQEAQAVSLDVSGMKQLLLRATGYSWGQATWGEAMIVAKDGSRTRIADLSPSCHHVGWGRFSVNVGPNGQALKIGSRTLAHGIFAHADSQIVYNLAGKGAIGSPSPSPSFNGQSILLSMVTAGEAFFHIYPIVSACGDRKSLRDDRWLCTGRECANFAAACLVVADGNAEAEIGEGNAQPDPLVYTPAPDFNGEDRFYVRVTDDGGEVAVTEVIVTVNPINDPPEIITPPSFATPIFAGAQIYALAGLWTDTRDFSPGQITLSYQWLSADSANGDNAVAIATSLNYQTTEGDLGRWLALEVTATDDGEGLPTSTSTAATTEFAFVGLPLVVDFVHPPTELPTPVAEGNVFTFQVEVSGGVPPYTYTWSIDETLVSTELRSFDYEPDYDAVLHPDFNRDLNLVCRVTDAGGTSHEKFVWTVRVGDVDRLPPAPEINILPALPRTLDDLSLEIVDPVDPDGDAIVGYDVSWRLLAANRDAFTGPTLPWQNTSKGQAWQAQAFPLPQPYGGLHHLGLSSGSATFIHNTAPTALAIGPIPVQGDLPIEIQLLGNDPDVRDGTDTLRYEIVDDPLGTLLALNGDGLMRYTPAGVSDSFSYRVRDNESAESAPATVELDVDGWSLRIDVSNESPDTLVLGMHPNVFELPPAALPTGSVGILIDGKLYQEQFQAAGPGAEWLIHVDAQDAQAPVILSWDRIGLPLEGLYLDEPGRSLLIDMAERNTVTVDPGEQREFRVRFARVSFTMPLPRDWSLVSLPIVPVEIELDQLFPEPLGTGLAFEGDQLISTNVAEVGRIYWVLNDGPVTSVTFEGSKAPPEFWKTELLPGAWNPLHVVGSPPWAPRRRADVMEAPGRIFPVLGWDPHVERWRPGPLLPGRGYFAYAEE